MRMTSSKVGLVFLLILSLQSCTKEVNPLSASSAFNIPNYFVDKTCEDADSIKTLFYTLSNQYHQQREKLAYSTLEETFNAFKQYPKQSSSTIQITPWIIKAGINGTTDALLQAMFIYLKDDDCHSFGAAFGKETFNSVQVENSATLGLVKWHTPSKKLGKAGFKGIIKILNPLIDGKYGESNYTQMGYDFTLGFFEDLGGTAGAELQPIASLPKLGKGLLYKYGIHYKIVTNWLGGGLQLINKTYLHNGYPITATRIMKGFGEKKIAVIGRSMNARVIPFATYLAAELGVPAVTWTSYNPLLSDAQNIANNQAWLKLLKEEGYTFYDIGLDPFYTAQGNFDEGLYYSMELNEIFR
ncbi:hypothetical protein [Sediminibacterium sp.]|uniref:hypothetical protein n=1 Tax=Sediminibacterium sp. TaxID=1917865 RepID=UPI003F714B91